MFLCFTIFLNFLQGEYSTSKWEGSVKDDLVSTQGNTLDTTSHHFFDTSPHSAYSNAPALIICDTRVNAMSFFGATASDQCQTIISFPFHEAKLVQAEHGHIPLVWEVSWELAHKCGDVPHWGRVGSVMRDYSLHIGHEANHIGKACQSVLDSLGMPAFSLQFIDLRTLFCLCTCPNKSNHLKQAIKKTTMLHYSCQGKLCYLSQSKVVLVYYVITLICFSKYFLSYRLSAGAPRVWIWHGRSRRVLDITVIHSSEVLLRYLEDGLWQQARIQLSSPFIVIFKKQHFIPETSSEVNPFLLQPTVPQTNSIYTSRLTCSKIATSVFKQFLINIRSFSVDSMHVWVKINEHEASLKLRLNCTKVITTMWRHCPTSVECKLKTG